MACIADYDEEHKPNDSLCTCIKCCRSVNCSCKDDKKMVHIIYRCSRCKHDFVLDKQDCYSYYCFHCGDKGILRTWRLKK